MVRMNKYTFKYWMVVLRNAHTFGNDWNIIFYAIYGIIFHVELVEGKDWPPHLPEPISGVIGKTIVLFVQLTRPIYSGLCVLKVTS